MFCQSACFSLMSTPGFICYKVQPVRFERTPCRNRPPLPSEPTAQHRCIPSSLVQMTHCVNSAVSFLHYP